MFYSITLCWSIESFRFIYNHIIWNNTCLFIIYSKVCSNYLRYQSGHVGSVLVSNAIHVDMLYISIEGFRHSWFYISDCSIYLWFWWWRNENVFKCTGRVPIITLITYPHNRNIGKSKSNNIKGLVSNTAK